MQHSICTKRILTLKTKGCVIPKSTYQWPQETFRNWSQIKDCNSGHQNQCKIWLRTYFKKVILISCSKVCTFCPISSVSLLRSNINHDIKMTGMTTAIVVADGRRNDTNDNIVYQRNLNNSLSKKLTTFQHLTTSTTINIQQIFFSHSLPSSCPHPRTQSLSLPPQKKNV